MIGRADWIGWPLGHWIGGLERPGAFDGVPAARQVRMGNRGQPARRPRRRRRPAADRDAGATGAPARCRRRAERRRLARKVKRRRRRSPRSRRYRSSSCVALLIALVLKTFLVQAFVIPSGSMEQTIQIGDRVLVDKLTPVVRLQAAARRRRRLQGPRRLAPGRADAADRRIRPIVVKQVKEALTFIGLLPSDDEQDLIKRVVGGRRRHRQVLRHRGPGHRQRHAAERAAICTRATRPRPSQFEVKVPAGPALRDGRPPVQLRRLPLPPRRARTRARSPRTRSWAGPW